MKDQKYIDLLVSRFKLRDNFRGDPATLHSEAARLGRLISDYEKENPDLRGIYHEENMMEARIQYQGDQTRTYFLTELKPFEGDPDRIPEIPVYPVWWLSENVWPGLIRAGAIQKKDLTPGKKYLGSCRNASEATWDGKSFWYPRTKFGDTYLEEINHFQDDDGHDVFIPIKEL